MKHYDPQSSWLLFGFAFSLVAGCSTSPRLETGQQEPQPVVHPLVLIDGGRRAASPQEYQDLLEDDAPGVDTQVMLDQLISLSQELSGSALVAGNDIRLLIDGPSTFELMFEDIDQARESIHLETFILADAAIGQTLLERLIASRRRGVEVRLLIDAIGSFDLPADFIQQLRDQGIELRKFHPVNPAVDPRIWRSNNRNHRKLLVIDGKVAYSGGINFSGAYSQGSFSAASSEDKPDQAWRDTHLRIVGPVVHQFQRQFLTIWNKDLPQPEQLTSSGHFPTIESLGNMMAGVITSSGGDSNEFDIYAILAAAISHAQEKVWITQAYFAPDEPFIAPWSDTRATADSGANWPYASSMMTSPGARAVAASTTARSSTTPVGLFGEHRNSTAGSASVSTRSISSRPTAKSASRSPSTTAVPVIRAMWLCRA
jgi:cardiolipin synthase